MASCRLSLTSSTKHSTIEDCKRIPEKKVISWISVYPRRIPLQRFINISMGRGGANHSAQPAGEPPILKPTAPSTGCRLDERREHLALLYLASHLIRNVQERRLTHLARLHDIGCVNTSFDLKMLDKAVQITDRTFYNFFIQPGGYNFFWGWKRESICFSFGVFSLSAANISLNLF